MVSGWQADISFPLWEDQATKSRGIKEGLGTFGSLGKGRVGKNAGIQRHTDEGVWRYAHCIQSSPPSSRRMISDGLSTL